MVSSSSQRFVYGLNVTWKLTLKTKEKGTHPSAVHMLYLRRSVLECSTNGKSIFSISLIERLKLEIESEVSRVRGVDLSRRSK